MAYGKSWLSALAAIRAASANAASKIVIYCGSEGRARWLHERFNLGRWPNISVIPMLSVEFEEGVGYAIRDADRRYLCSGYNGERFAWSTEAEAERRIKREGGRFEEPIYAWR